MPVPQSLPDFLRHVASLDRKALDLTSDSNTAGGYFVPDALADTLLPIAWQGQTEKGGGHLYYRR